MTRIFPLFPVILAAALLLVSPAAATLVLSGVSFSPDAPLVPGGQQHVVATYAVIPSGSTTFARGHTLQMQTNLTRAQWTIQVTLDGRDAARQTASGPAAFVNGEILSFSTDHDTSLKVTVNGTVPSNASGSLTVLQVEELDNGGTAVPGSSLAISQPVTGPATPATPSLLPALTPPLVTTTLPKETTGFAVPAVFSALTAGVLLMQAGKKER